MALRLPVVAGRGRITAARPPREAAADSDGVEARWCLAAGGAVSDYDFVALCHAGCEATDYITYEYNNERLAEGALLLRSGANENLCAACKPLLLAVKLVASSKGLLFQKDKF